MSNLRNKKVKSIFKVSKDRGVIAIMAKEESKKSVCVINPIGRITFQNSLDLKDQWAEMIKGGKYKQVILDLCDIGFVDSSGMSVIISFHKECKKKGIAFSIANCQKRVRELFQILKIDMVIPVHEGVLNGKR